MGKENLDQFVARLKLAGFTYRDVAAALMESRDEARDWLEKYNALADEIVDWSRSLAPKEGAN